jgi:hypothetical protein
VGSGGAALDGRLHGGGAGGGCKAELSVLQGQAVTGGGGGGQGAAAMRGAAGEQQNANMNAQTAHGPLDKPQAQQRENKRLRRPVIAPHPAAWPQRPSLFLALRQPDARRQSRRRSGSTGSSRGGRTRRFSCDSSSRVSGDRGPQKRTCSGVRRRGG